MKKILAIIIILVFSHLKIYSQTPTDGIRQRHEERLKKYYEEQKKDPLKVRLISLSISQALKIPYSSVNISINKIRDKIEVKIKSDASNESKEWDYSRINKTFDMSAEDFLELKKSLKKINLNTVFQGMEYSFKDGYGTGLSYGGFGGTVSLKFQTPTSRTQERGLEDYLNACILILKKGGLEDYLIKEILHLKNLPK